MIPLSRHMRLTAGLMIGALVILGLFLSSRGGPLFTAFPRFAVLTPFALVSVAGLLAAALWPVSAVAVAAIVPFYSPDIRSLGTALGCVSVAVLCTLWRRGRSPWLEPMLLAVLGAVVVLLSYAAPVAAPPTSRLYVVYAVYIGAAVSVIGFRAATVVALLGFVSLYASYRAITSPSLGGARSGDVLLGLNANGVGFLCALAMVIGAVAARQQAARYKLAGTLFLVLGLFGTVQSGSRGAFLAALAGIAVVVLHRYIARADSLGFFTLAVVAVGLYFLSSPAMNWLARASGRNTSEIQQNVTERAGATQYALHVAIQHPFSGVGLASLDEYSLSDPNASYHLSAHNVFVGRFAESGVVVGLLFVFLLGLAVVRARRHSPRVLLPIVVFLFVSGISLDWFVEGRLGVLAFIALAGALAAGHSREPISHDLRIDPSPEWSTTH